MMTKSQKAARKGARTRLAHQIAWKRYYEIDKPAIVRLEILINRLLSHETVRLRWIGDRRLKKGAEYGVLVRFLNGGRLWRVLVEGYKQPQDFHPSYWEVLGAEE